MEVMHERNAHNFSLDLSAAKTKFSVSVRPLELALVKTGVTMVKHPTNLEHVGLLLVKVGISILTNVNTTGPFKIKNPILTDTKK